MYVILVVPLQRGTTVESLSYFSSVTYPLGTFLAVPIRGKQQTAVVIDCKPVSSTKTALKAATFSLRKLPQQDPLGHIPDSLLTTATKLSERLPAKPGAILFAFLPPDIRNGSVPYPQYKPHIGEEDTTPAVLQGPRQERFVHYRSFIRTAFAHRGSVLFVVPTSPDVERVRTILKSGIEERVVCFSGQQTKKERLRAYEQFDDLSTAKLIITTPSHAYLERSDITSIIIDEVASPHYRARTRPYLDHTESLRVYAAATNRSCLLGDLVVRTEHEHWRREELFSTHGEEPKRFAFPSTLSLINQKEQPTSDESFTLFTDSLKQSIKNALAARGKVLLLAARRGLAPVVMCFDCGFIFRCPDSGTPYSLLRTYEKGEEKRWFLSSTSGRRVPAADVCERCGSWRLRERGIGIQQVEDECKKLFPEHELVLFDHTTARTSKKARELAATAATLKGGIILGTQMIFPYLSFPVDLSAITSLDATRAVPSWRADEQLFHTLLTLRDRTTNEVIVQSRSEADDLLIYASRGAVERFFTDEIKLRKMVNYPPFATLVLLTWTGNDAAVKQTELLIKERLADWNVHLYPSPRSVPQKVTKHGLLRVERSNWPEPVLIEALRSLPPHIKVEIDPDRIV